METFLIYAFSGVAVILALAMAAFVVRGARVRSEVTCQGGQWTTVIQNWATGFPASWTCTFETTDGRPVSGTYREKRALWIFPQTPVTGPLQPEMTFHRQWINAIYSLEVQPNADTVVKFV